ncbi:MAG: B12-binding domain-containing radical SAM protein, partial [Planctomycetota bacterium JB042]
MRVTLIYAKSRLFKEKAKGIGGFDEGAGEYARDDVFPPLGIACLGAVLEEKGHEVRLIDDSIEEDSVIDEAIRWSEVVGVTALTSNARRANELGRMAKGMGKFTVAGGPHPTVAPEFFLEGDDPPFDLTVQSEGDLVLPEILDNVDRPENWPNIKNLTFKRDGELVQTPRRGFIKDLDSLPFPAYHLYDMNRYFKYMVNPGIPIVSSRGCPYACTFCDAEMTPRNYRAMSAERTVELMDKMMRDYDAPQMFFFDDLFTINKKRVMAICEELIRRGIFVEWSAESRVDTVTHEMLRLMRKAGCIKLYFGLESGSPNQLITMKKSVTPEGILKGAKLTREIGIYFKFFIIYGFPGETDEDHACTEEIVKRSLPHNIAVSLLCPHKGTEVYDQIKDRIIHQPEVVEYGYWHQTVMWRHDRFSFEELQA